MKLTISGYSTALFSTWYFIEELGILMDAGDGLMSTLLQKSRKIKYAFISHADRDHMMGLLQFIQLNTRPGFPIICYPKDSGSFPALEAFSKLFDKHVQSIHWQPVEPAARIFIKEDIAVIPIRNEHVDAAPSVIRSLSYKIVQVKQKVKPEIAILSPDEIKQIILEQGKDKTTIEVETNLISYSGDTPVSDWERWNNSNILIHEATFLEENVASHKNKHSTLFDVLEMVSNININTLILGHFSSRYSPEQIDQQIRTLCKKLNINIPVYRLLPGITTRDIFAGPPINL